MSMKPRRATCRGLFPRRQDAEGWPLCCVCGVKLVRKNGRPKSALYCGKACVDHAWVCAGRTETIRRLLWERDRGICALCGFDTGVVMKATEAAYGLTGFGLRFLTTDWYCGNTPLEVPPAVRSASLRLDELAKRISAAARHWIREHYGLPPWEADHIVPVVEGGGGCGLDGYRTLCRACHVVETGRLRRRLAAEARRARVARAGETWGRGQLSLF